MRVAVQRRAQADDGQAGRGPGGETSVQVGGVDQAELLQAGCGQAGLVSLVADQDDAEVPAGEGGMSPLGGGVAAPFQDVAGDHQGAGDQAVAPLVVTADVDQERTTGLGAQRLGRRGAVRQHVPGLGEQLIHSHGGSGSGDG